jgi:hypothetical protein
MAISIKTWIHFLLMLLMAGSTQSANTAAPDMGVRLVDVRNGRVFANEIVNVQFHVPRTPELQTLEQKTGTDGTAKFRLPEPLPASIVVFATNERLYPCSSRDGINTQKIIHEGLVSRCSKSTQGCRCKFSRQVSEIQNKAGELVLFARPVTRWEKFLQHIWE